MSDRDERYRRGVHVLQRLSGESIEQVTNKVAEIAPDFARMTIEFPFGARFARHDAHHPALRLSRRLADASQLGRPAPPLIAMGGGRLALDRAVRIP